MNIFEFQNYRAAFTKLFEKEKKIRGSSWSIARLGEKTQIQPSYLTNVTKERAHFSSDQIYAVCESLGLSEEETSFLNLMMEWERATHAKRKQALRSRLELLRGQNIRVEKYVKAPQAPLSEIDKQRYYLDPNIELIHLYLGTKSAPVEAQQIAQAWGLPESTVVDILAFLQKSGLVRLRGRKWEVENIHQHLSQESPLCRPQQILKRLRGIETLQRTPEEKTFSFAATVTMTEETKLAIKARFLEFLEAAEKLVRDSEAKGIYQIQFDLFPWIAS
jgi:uncharacterized protein (TIGR02147 family)